MSESSKTAAGSRLWIGSTAAIDFSTPETALAAFEAEFDDASPPKPEVGNISNFGTIGPLANIVTFPVLSDAYVQKGKGTRNAGDPVCVVGRLPNDPGQVAMREAEESNYYYNFRLELNDAPDENHSNTVIYFRALVAGAQIQIGANEEFVTDSYALGIYPQPLVVESAELSP